MRPFGLADQYAPLGRESNDTYTAGRELECEALASRTCRTLLTLGLICALPRPLTAQVTLRSLPSVYQPPAAVPLRISASDADELRAVLNAARTGEGPRIRAGMEAMHDPFAREIALWALTDSAPTAMSFAEADSARRDLADWPDRTRRQAAAENLLDQSGLSPQATVSWFAGAEPQTPRGALALATALNATGHASAAADLIRKAWRTEVFDQATQDAILTRFSGT